MVSAIAVAVSFPALSGSGSFSPDVLPRILRNRLA